MEYRQSDEKYDPDSKKKSRSKPEATQWSVNFSKQFHIDFNAQHKIRDDDDGRTTEIHVEWFYAETTIPGRDTTIKLERYVIRLCRNM